MSHRIIPRAEWGARPARNRTQVAASRRKYFTLHYDSEHPRTATGNSVPRGIQNFHMDTRGWADIGYNFVIDQAGNIFEGRGWNILGAHAEAAGNAVGIGVQIHIGGNQKPSQAALNAADWLWDQANARFGKRLALAGHRDFTPTSCPGSHLYKIVASGTIPHTPAPGGSTVPLGDTPTPTSPTPGTPTPAPNPKEFPDMDATEFKKLFKAAFKESLRDPEIAGDVARAALGGTYGIDITGDGKNDTAGNLLAATFTKVASIETKLADNTRKEGTAE